MKRISPLVQMTLALVALATALVMLADLFFAVLPNRADEALQRRAQIGEVVSAQVAALLRDADRTPLRRTLASLVEQLPGLRSVAVRRADGTLLVQAGDHAGAWKIGADGRLPEHLLAVPLLAGNERWGSVEMAFKPDERSDLQRWLAEPVVVLMLFISSVGAVGFGLYMRRALQHLDPASVIPDRVQGAFDALAEGVVVLDARGRVMLGNKAFRALHAQAVAVRPGMSLSGLPWLAETLPADPAQHPWTRAMSERRPNTGHTVELARGSLQARQLVINCAPITDTAGNVRGCMTTFDDTTALHRAHEQLREAMQELSVTQDEIVRKNEELLRLATRDPMTGCLNRRAFLEAFEPMFRDALRNGTALGCVMLDIDHFKKVNDTHGHAIGDRVIQEVAKKLQLSARSTDLVCRYGGEEFVIIVPGLDGTEVAAFAERVRQRIEQECGPGVREVPGMMVTASIGVDALGDGASNPQELVDRADQALYCAKRGGRNQVCRLAGELSVPADL